MSHIDNIRELKEKLEKHFQERNTEEHYWLLYEIAGYLKALKETHEELITKKPRDLMLNDVEEAIKEAEDEKGS